MSGRNNEREQRARERDRLRQEAHVMNALRARAMNGPGAAAQNNNEDDGARQARGAVEPFAAMDLVSSPRASGNSAVANQGLKRKFNAAIFGPESVESWASTELEQETFAFLWTLRGYSSFNSNTEEIKSPVFKGGLKSNHLWQLKMNPKKKMEDLEYFAVHLILNGFGDADCNSRRLKVRFQISLLDNDGHPGKQAGSSTMSVCEFKKFSVWGYDKFLSAQEITSPTRRLVDNDTLKIHCRIWIEGDLKHNSGVGGASSDNFTEDEIKKRRFKLLSQNFGGLLRDSVFGDVAISTETKTFLAHKAVLAARSSVFKAMFTSGMLESAQNTVEIHDFEEEVVNAMLEYMYTGETPALKEKAPDLMQIAEKYDLSGLKEDCEHAIAANLTVENCAKLLVLAHLHNAVQLKPKVIEFINRNKSDVRRTQSFQQMSMSNAAVFVDLYLSQ